MSSIIASRTLLLASSAMLFVGTEGAWAKATGKTSVTGQSSKTASRAASHQMARPETGGVNASQSQAEHISVTGGMSSANGRINTTPGGGMMIVQDAPKARSGVSKDYIAKQAPMSSAQSLVAAMPGVAYARTDPFGLSSASMTIRGLDQTEIGYLVEGIPLMDSIYLQPDARVSPDTENLSSVQLSQGSPDMSSPAYWSVGGQIDATLRDPSRKAGGYVSSSYGSWKSKREFIRLDSGEIGHTGIRVFGSYSYTFGDNWFGPGSYDRHHVDAKAIKEWGHGNSVGLTLFWGQYQSYQSGTSLTLQDWREHGTSALYYSPTYTPGSANFYGLQRQNLSTWSLIAPMKFNLGHQVKLNVRPYFIDWGAYHNYGESIPQDGAYFGTEPVGHINTPYAVNGSIVTEAIDPLFEHTLGLTSDVSWTRGHNTLRLGDMYAYLDMTEQMGFAIAGPHGFPANAWGSTDIMTPYGQLSGWNIAFRQQTNSIWLDDTYRALDDRLTLMVGFKEVMISRVVTNDIPGASTYKNGGSYAEPLPQAAISYRITPHDQIYVNGTTSFKAPGKSEAYIDIYDPNAKGLIVQGHPPNERAEYAIGEEIGYRHTGLFNVSAALFNYNMTNHQVGSQSYVDGTYVSATINVGGETLRGAQLELSMRPWHHFSPYLSGSYIHATFDNNYPVYAAGQPTQYLPTAGKTAVNTPTFTAAAGLAYDDGTYFGNFNLNYVGRRYTTFMNDESVPGYIWTSITVGYRMHNVWRLKRPQLQLNFQNIGNNIYFADASGVTSNAHAQRSMSGTTVSGTAPQYTMGGGFALIGTISTGF
ncbi:TonB-dependent receptor plug domain-containing protein [Gluconacetobacter entanii]|uniref:TonB-dependent receptor plug domain-containing protein n=2 Tax=Gluconacetobacter entanii TaxID=108528 RepID=A0ABT3K4E8_9PROT|nr:TonB-dependent receptor plug domain-containing protein [Gluconacetobacter entanii]MCW4590243.1 TonB-dependent receptor plug domain-containing protein [Gluconacetobacter entanii]MCW4594284.1 TonB-dependent receptor plug domain-containing protein [Gluconacetobacter entanii]NPC89489.1 TonB-dependent receptor plug domain-containing protein [Gluconacetobacter entanii]